MLGEVMEFIVYLKGMKRQRSAINSSTCHVHTHHKLRVSYMYVYMEKVEYIGQSMLGEE